MKTNALIAIVLSLPLIFSCGSNKAKTHDSGDKSILTGEAVTCSCDSIVAAGDS